MRRKRKLAQRNAPLLPLEPAPVAWRCPPHHVNRKSARAWADRDTRNYARRRGDPPLRHGPSHSYAHWLLELRSILCDPRLED